MTYKILTPLTFLICTGFLFGCGSSDGTDSNDDQATTIPDTENSAESALRINEIVAAAENNGNDWIELYATEGTINLSDYTLVDDNADREPQALPNVTLAAGEFIVINAIDEDDTPPENGYYVTFKLGSDDAVTLFKNGIQVDQLDWNEGEALSGFSYGLFTDGSDNAQTLTPTPGTANAITTNQETVLTDLVTMENTALRINEIVAADSNNGYDWIELYVTGESHINLSDYSITDENGIAAALPNQTLSPGEFYRVYATTDEIANRVSFKLGSNDEVKLFLGDDLVDHISWKKGQALVGYSFGRFPDGSDNTQVLSPSPMEENSLAAHGPLVISEVVANDAFAGYDWFELFNSSNNNIALANYKVIDSSDDIDPIALPDVTLAPGDYMVIYAVDEEISDYHVLFKLGKTDELSLILDDQTVDYIDWDDSDVREGFSYGLSAIDTTYTVETNSVINTWDKDFLTPTKGFKNQRSTAFNPDVVSNLYFNISTENWQSILANPLDEEYHETSITFNNVTLDSVAIRTKGGSSLSSVANSPSDRYSFKIDINAYVDGQKFFGLKKFTLQNSFNDPSYMRETIAYNLLKEMGVATPQHAYVNVYINNELFGFYLMVEAIDGEFIENHFANSKGDLYKPDGVGSDLKWIDDDITSYSDINLQTNEETSDQGAFIHFVEQLNNGSTEVIDVDSLLRYMSVSVALSNLDSYHGSLAHNYYIYEQDAVFSLLPWDLNEAFGSFNMGCTTDIRELYIDEPTDGPLADKPLIANVFANQYYLNTYHDYLWQLINGPLSSDVFHAEVARIADLIREHVQHDPSAFYSAAQFEQNLHSTVGRFYGLTEFIDYRVLNMTKQLLGTLPSTGNGNGFCAGGGPSGRP